ncbi:MAG TPA: hybrid sensor histidine kinase/response regulator [Kofleriaceae bacterium]|nr:hybrid sensor histidine kinase/response regulator [Kofleriaceae bacterium]
MEAGDVELTVYVLATLPRDAELTCEHLHRDGIAAACTSSFDELLDRLDGDIGAVLLTEEAVPPPRWGELAARVASQPAWSDIPIIVCARKRQSNVDRFIRGSANITVIETPVRVTTVVSAARAAVRARKRQYEMRDLLRRLEDADRRKDEFLAMLGHELRNPLAAIQLAVQLKRMRAPEEAPDAQMQVIERQLRTLGRIVDDLLDVSRITLGKIRLEIRDVDLCEVARRCVQALGPEAQASQLEMTVCTPDAPVLVRGDAVRLEQIVCNLVTNAIKYTPAGGSVRVEVCDDSAPRLAVRDSGIGLDAAILPRVFDLFSQAKQGIDRSRGGLGLGLALVKRLVEMHGGRVEVASDGAGRGSTFTVQLPPPEADGAPREVAPEVSAAVHADVHIIVVEDNEDARLMLGDLLERRGQRVETAPDGIAGLQLALDRRPDVMLIDIGLPKLDGSQLAREIRRSLVDPPLLIAMTGYGHERERALAAGFDLFMVKPIDVLELETALATLREQAPPVHPGL